MADPRTAAAWLLVLGPVIGAIPIAYPPFLSIWTNGREHHLRTVGAHGRAWVLLNAGFALATLATVCGLALLVASPWASGPTLTWLTAVTVLYGAGGLLWIAVLAIRARTTPVLARYLADDVDTEPGETLLGAATGGLYGAFVVTTAVALLVLGAGLLATGAIVAPVAAIIGVSGALLWAWLLLTGDIIPATAYLPTMLLGVALLAGWT